jgi:hypothetical protein
LDVLLHSIPRTIKAEWLLIFICPPAGHAQPAGVLLLDRNSNQLFFRLRGDLRTGDEDIDIVWERFAEELDLRASEEGPAEVVEWLKTSFSNVFRVSDLRTLLTQNASQALDSLYEDHVEKPRMTSRSA